MKKFSDYLDSVKVVKESSDFRETINVLTVFGKVEIQYLTNINDDWSFLLDDDDDPMPHPSATTGYIAKIKDGKYKNLSAKDITQGSALKNY